ncbi:hypothetical protein RAAC3_TM7C00001G0512 [Candidatus Saccharibacteria bacterium RAAC3_TM7_1]|nr:hypothetical protein RAAC3_TM7C00001G0512 [Candidatus Saccharibacteria bacterium RAAC3_TM7_1]HCZ28640.1 hypothetical protein [Candidatus Saccharibacteria bacterium]
MEKHSTNTPASPDHAVSPTGADSKEVDGYNLDGSDYDAFVASFKAGRAEKDARWERGEPVELRRPSLYRRLGGTAVSLVRNTYPSRRTNFEETAKSYEDMSLQERYATDGDNPLSHETVRTTSRGDWLRQRANKLDLRSANRAANRIKRNAITTEKLKIIPPSKERKSEQKRRLRIRRTAARLALNAYRDHLDTMKTA